VGDREEKCLDNEDPAVWPSPLPQLAPEKPSKEGFLRDRCPHQLRQHTSHKARRPGGGRILGSVMTN
jgi:hypothetical protein